MTTVLFTGGGGAGSGALARAGAYDGYGTHFADADQCARPFGVSPDRWHVIPCASDPWFVSAIEALCQKIDADLIVPGVDEELVPLAQMERGPRVMVPPVWFVKDHLDKLRSMERLGAVVSVPRTVACSEWLRPPCIVKPRMGRGSRGVGVVTTALELRAHLLLTKTECVLQERLEGTEFTVTVAADSNGKLRAIVPIRVSLKRGVTIRARTYHDSDVIRVCQRIHEAYPVPGCYNVQGIKGPDGVFRPFELNPRISTTACLAMAAGVDIIGIYLGKYPGEDLLPFTDGLELRRSWHNEFVAA